MMKLLVYQWDLYFKNKGLSMTKVYTLILLSVLGLNASILISPMEAMAFTYGADTKIEKKNILLSKAQARVRFKKKQK